MRTFCSILGACALSSHIYAQVDSSLSLSDLLSTKLSTGTFLDLDLSRSPLSLTTITHEQIDYSGARNLSELIEIYVPGFQYMYNKWNGTVWGMRGVASDRNTKILFLVNGHKMNTESRDGAISETDIGMLGDIERVEVLRGPAGLVYGSGAIAGIINVVTARHLEYDKLDKASVTLGTYDLGSTNTEIQGTAHSATEDGSISVDFGYRSSEGVGQERARIYGRGSWPYPYWLDNPPRNGAVTTGSALSTPGNYKVGLNWEHKNLRVYSRFTHQVTNASGWFVLDPWSDVNGAVSDGTPSFYLDTLSRRSIQQGTSIRPQDGYLLNTYAGTALIPAGQDTLMEIDDTSEVWVVSQTGKDADRKNSTVDGELVDSSSWYANINTYNNNRRQYVIDNVFVELMYFLEFGENRLNMSASVDGVTNQIRFEQIAGYENEYIKERTNFANEAFGERRFTLNGTYLLNSIRNFQAAMGYEWRMDDIGNDLLGHNAQNGNEKHLIVSDVVYQNHALFFEGIYALMPKLDLHAGVRWDGHTRTLGQRDELFHIPGVVSPKASVIYSPLHGHSVKMIFQSASNNGSADNYEYNRNFIDDEGNVASSFTFRDPYAVPNPLFTPRIGVSLSTLHALKPERCWSAELATQHQMLNNWLNLGTSISYNTISNLFSWNQRLFRVVNTGSYHFVTAELEASYTRKHWNIGANHAYQRVVNTDVEGQEEYVLGPVFDTSKDWYDTLYDDNGRAYYVPEPTSYSDTIRYNAVRDQITVDGKNFLNLVPHITKVFLDWEFLPHLIFHTDARIFWGLFGREDIYDYKKTTTVTGTSTEYDTTWIVNQDKSITQRIDTITTEVTSSSSNHEYLDDLGYTDNTIFNTLGIENSPMVKWNISLHWIPRDDLRISAFIYNLLGQDNGSGNSMAVNTLRWQSYLSPEATDLYGTDLRSYAIRVEKTF